MEFLDLVKQRYAQRDYENKEVEEEKLQRILEVGRLAPTAANRQPQRFYIIRKEDMPTFENAVNFHGAPLAILICAYTKEAWVRKYDDMNAGVIDASIVCTHMMMEATQLGLGSLWVCAFDPEKVKDVCGLAEGMEPINILCLGYGKHPGDIHRFVTTRKPLEEFILRKKVSK